MKKFTTILYTILLALSIPFAASAVIPVGWNAIDATTGVIQPNRVNGTDQAVKAPYFTATSTSATSTFAGGIAAETSGFVYNYGSNNVGIGTTSPSRVLQIENSGANLFSVQRTGYDAYGFLQSAGTGLHIYDFTDSRTDMFFDGAGNVGIGTTSPQGTLDVTVASDSALYVSRPAANAIAINAYNPGSGNGDHLQLAGFDHYFYTTGSTIAAGTEKMRLASGGGLSLGNSYVSTATGAGGMIMSGSLGVGTTTQGAKIHSLATTEQLRLGYDATNYTAFTMSSSGDLTMAPTGADLSVTGIIHVPDSTTGGFYAGTGNDLRMYHDGTNSYVENTTGELLIYQNSASDIIRFYNNAANTVTIDATGEMGIGNATPLTTLHVGAGTTVTTFPDGNASGFTPQIVNSQTSGIAGIGVSVSDGVFNRRAGFFVNHTNSVWGLGMTYSSTVIPFVIVEGVTERLRIDTSGRLGILGATSPTNSLSFGNAAVRKIWIENSATDVVGRDLTMAAGGTIAGTSVSDVTGGNLILQAGLGTGAGASTISFQNGTTLGTGTTLQTMSTKMTILGNGNVGIGGTSPDQLLSLNVTTGNTYISWRTGASSKAFMGVSDAVDSPVAGMTAGDLGIRVQANDLFMSADSGSSGQLVLKNSGNVGVGTTTPGSKLSVTGTAGTGDVFTVASSTQASLLTIKSTGQSLFADGTAALPAISFGSDPDTGFYKEAGDRLTFSAAGSARIFFDTISIQVPAGSASGPGYRFSAETTMGMFRAGTSILAFSTASTQRMTIDADGDVGIGTTTPLTKLAVLSTTEQLRVNYDASNYYSTTVGSTGGVTFDAIGAGSAFTFSDDASVPDEAYAVGWNGSLEVPTKNAVYDKVETIVAGSGFATTELDNLGVTAINAHLLFGADATYDIGASATGINDIHFGSGGVINLDGGDVTLTHSANTLTLAGGDLALGANNITMTGSLAATGARVTKGWFTDVESTNMYTVGGTSLSSVAQTFTNKTLGDALILSENAAVLLDPALSADGKYNGITEVVTAGETVAFGDIVYLKAADSQWYLTDADADATAGAVRVAIAVTSGTDNNTMTIMTYGKIRADANFPALTVGAPGYISITAGDIQVAQPSGTDDVIRMMGHANTADEFMFNPSNDYTTHI